MNLNGKIKKTQALSGRLLKSSGGGGSVQEIYWVQYGVGTATNAEVNEAVAANKLPICYWDSTDAYGRPRRTLYFLVRHTPTEAFFATVLPTTQIIEVKRLYADAWDTQTIRYEGKLTWDTTPRFGSANPVTSGGIYNAIQNATVSDERIAEAVDDWLSVQAPSIGTLSYAAKQALLACFRHVAWIDDQGQSYYNALESELFPDATLESITAVFTQGSAVIYDTDSLDTLRQYLTVTATYSDSTTAVVSDYTLSGTLTAGTSTITASYGGKTDTFTVAVSIGLDSVAYGTMTYRDIFVTNNLYTYGNFEHEMTIDSTWRSADGAWLYKSNAGSPVLSTDAANSPTHSLKCFGTGSTQIAYNNNTDYFSGSYLCCIAVKVERYVKGSAGIQIITPLESTIERTNVAVTTTTQGFVAAVGIHTTAASRKGMGCYTGTYTSANCDAYVDDVVITPLPSGMTQAEGETLYANYLEIVGRAS